MTTWINDYLDFGKSQFRCPDGGAECTRGLTKKGSTEIENTPGQAFSTLKAKNNPSSTKVQLNSRSGNKNIF